MKRRMLRWDAAACMLFLGLVAAATLPSDAQTWRWKYVTRTPNAPPLAAQSTVDVTARELRMTYTVPLGRRQVVIESCRAALSDVASATTVNTQGRTYLLVQLKPSRAAACASGKRPAVALPTDDAKYVGGVAAAINHSCCSAVPVVAKVAASPSPRAPAAAAASPTATPASPKAIPTPQSASAPLTTDWVESEGLFTFVRVRNAGNAEVHINSIEIFACRDVVLGCGPLPRDIALDARHIATIATVASGNQRSLAAFRYRYVAARNDVKVTRGGSSATSASRRSARMSAQEVRTAEAAALGDIRGPARAPAPPAIIAPARLITRGSSRLAIGQTGTALVRLLIAENGTPQEATIVRISNRRLTAAAIETAVSSTYAPATQNGKPIAAKYVATFSFDGEDPATASIPVWKRSPAPTVSGVPSPAPPTTAPSAPSQGAASPPP